MNKKKPLLMKKNPFQVSQRWHDIINAFSQRKLAVIGLVIFIFLLLIAMLAPVIVPHDPTNQELMDAYIPPSWENCGSKDYLLGTDNFGRDIFSRLLFGGRISISAAGFASAFSMIFGVMIGIIAGYFGGKVEDLLMRFVDIFLSFPMVLIALALASIVGPSFRNIILIMALTGWMTYARTIAATTKSVRTREFVDAAVSIGAPTYRILLRHILPNVITPALVLFTFGFAQFIILESALSYLGLGVPPPTPTWGRMLYDARAYMRIAPWMMMAPGTAIMLVTLSLNFIGDGLRDSLDLRTRSQMR